MCETHVATYKEMQASSPSNTQELYQQEQGLQDPYKHHHTSLPSHSQSFSPMAEGGHCNGHEYADPGGSETTLTNANFQIQTSNFRGRAGTDTGAKSKLHTSQRRPRSPSPDTWTQQLNISMQEFTSQKLILKETVNLITQQEVIKKKGEKTKTILLIFILILTNLLTLVCSNYITNLLTPCLQHSSEGPADSSTPLSKEQLDLRLDSAWITDGPDLQTATIEEPTNPQDQGTDSLTEPIEAIEAKITIWEPSKQPPRNETMSEESIWSD